MYSLASFLAQLMSKYLHEYTQEHKGLSLAKCKFNKFYRYFGSVSLSYWFVLVGASDNWLVVDAINLFTAPTCSNYMYTGHLKCTCDVYN